MDRYESVTQLEIDQRVFDLYDEYCHGGIDRREFLKRASLIAGGLAMAQALFPRYAEAQTISFTDSRIKATYVNYPSPGGNSGNMRGYLVQPAGNGPFPAVLVVHENRGLNPYVEDVNLARHEFDSQFGQALVVACGPAVFDLNVLPFDVSGFSKTFAKRRQIPGYFLRHPERPRPEVR